MEEVNTRAHELLYLLPSKRVLVSVCLTPLILEFIFTFLPWHTQDINSLPLKLNIANILLRKVQVQRFFRQSPFTVISWRS